MSPDEIQALLDLQELDLKLLEYENHQRELPALIEAIEAPLRAAGTAEESVRAELATAKSQHRKVELELVENNEKFKKLQTQQMGIRNQIEYEAFQHELEALKDRADTLEETGLMWIERADSAEQRLPELTEAREAADKAAAGRRAKLDAKTTELKRIHDESSVLTEPFLAKIPRQVLSYYTRLRQAGKIPVVSVVGRGACSGCGFRHPPQKLQEIKLRPRMATCEQCGRIQVWREEEAESIGF